ncbi:MAG: SMP-30/gluconolactonase/LRE family protein [Proteobacteria bacterium]|nr:SMP-30/gluconolactonase/LRE family protein [Pseudomonadota bacterium]MBU1388650.1 SMP-30/gluconolactonase/LRE family protein [Pseudomonadota bacterium]MBU1544881.1 SMP-30/gluconolactonase/LRE family protein [Pseudomonadota bacterium]MBU2430872.1 SMP-30/gluconolactonase/LRE family protein [Pseudomonadota bacterium]MBU2479467.1 SMP-30/gluconolactonase/LRE family protein [Pseudomonadota bacterium]
MNSLPADFETRTLVDGLLFPESPRWHDNIFYFSDMNDGRVIRTDLQGNTSMVLEMPGPCSGIGWRPDGTLLVVSMQDRRLMSWDGQTLEMVCDMYSLATYHCNDMVVDKKGRAYVGNFGFDLGDRTHIKPAEIIMVNLDGTPEVVADNLLFPNGTVITPDDKTLIVGQTFGHCLTAFDIKSDGRLGAPQMWAKLPDTIHPDGICLDTEGGIWVACPGTACVYRVEQGGRITDTIPVKTNAYACMLGGHDGTTLFIATSGNTYRSGKIETVRVNIPGAGLP